MEELVKELLMKLVPQFGEKLTDKIFNYTLPAIRLKANLSPADEKQTGQSRIGGNPDLPVGVPWPGQADNPLSFLLQINLAHSAKYPFNRDLPRKGLLSFFYDAQAQPWGYDPDDRGGWKVLYFDSIEQLVRRECPNTDVMQFQNGKFILEQQLVLPPANPVYIEEIGFTEQQAENYAEMLEPMQEGPCHWLLGHPAEIQGEMRLETQLAFNGIYCGNTIDFQDSRVAQLAETAQYWRLLLQVDSDEDIDMTWGDCGRLYFWIRQQDLLQGNFDNVWVILQCG